MANRSTLPFGLPRLFVIIMLLVGMMTEAHAQKEKNIWQFSNNLGLDFNTGAPIILTGGRLTQYEGGATVADRATGQLLFYTDSRTVWNSRHLPMKNGQDLPGDFSATQSALIVPMPGSSTRYYLFSATSVDSTKTSVHPNRTIGVTWSMVDMGLDGGLGDVVTKGRPLDHPAAEKITAVRHCNGRDYWVLTRGWGNDEFHAFLVSDRGLDTVPITSHSGHVVLSTRGGVGAMKAAPNGRWIALATYTEGYAELYPFDNTTGLVGSPITLSPTIYAYGVSFSPDNSKLYIGNVDSCTLDQYDLSSGDPATIRASLYRVSLPGYAFGSLQIAPDGRIYVACRNAKALGVINDPNARGAAMNFEPRGLLLPSIMQLGLPNMIDADIAQLSCIPPSPAFDFVPLICEGACNSFIDTSAGDPISWQWSFPGGNPSTSSERSPQRVCYASPGVYSVTLVVTNAYGSDSITRTLTVRARQLEIDPIAHPVLSRIELDSTLIGEARCDSIVLHNKGETPLVLTAKEAYMLSGRDFTITPGQYPLVIPPHGRRGVRICYQPTMKGAQHDGLVLIDSCVTIIAYIYSAGIADPPRGGFSMTSVEPCRMECLNFTDSSAWARSWQWSFPGAVPDTSSQQSPRSICYAEPGDHPVTLITGNRFGLDTVVTTVHVSATPRPSVASALDGNGALAMEPAEVSSRRWESVVIHAGSMPVVIASARLVVNTVYSLPPSQFPLMIPAGESRSIVIGVAPSEAGDAEDTLVIDDPCTPIMLPLALHADPPTLVAELCSTRLSFGGVADAGLLRIEAAYPNPARTRLRVPVTMILPEGVEPGMRGTLHDLLGRDVGPAIYAGRALRNGMGNVEEHGAFTIDVSMLPQGRYYLRLTIDANVTTIPVEVGR